MSRRTGALLVAFIALALYLPSLGNGFAYDDVAIIQLDERAHELSRAHRYFAEPYWAEADLGLYRPLTSVTYAVDWAVSGGTAGWFHLVNTFLNAAASVLLFLVLWTLTGTVPALCGALVFAVHPVHVEAVANIVGRAELLAATFSLAAVLVWLGNNAERSPSLRRSAAVGVLLGLALLSKESAIMLPAVLVLADVARGVLRPRTAGAWAARNSGALLLMLLVVMSFMILRTAVLGGLGPARVDPLLDLAASPSARVLTALQVWPVIARLLLFPRELLADYGPHVLGPASDLDGMALAGGIMLLLIVAGGVLAWFRGHGLLAFSLLVLPVTMLPVSNLIVPIGVLLAERTLYLPSIALASGIALLASRVGLVEVRRQTTDGAQTDTDAWPAARLVFTGALLLASVLLAGRTLTRIPEWRDTETIMRAQGRDRPETFRVAWYDARAAATAGDNALALERYGAALRMWPHRRKVVVEAAAFAAHAGDTPFAHRLAAYAVDRWPGDVAAIRLLSATALDIGDTAVARSAIDRGLVIAPRDSLLLQMRSVINGNAQ